MLFFESSEDYLKYFLPIDVSILIQRDQKYHLAKHFQYGMAFRMHRKWSMDEYKTEIDELFK